MKQERNRSLRWALMKRLFALQAFLLVLFVILLVGWIWIIDPRLEGANEEAVRIVAESVTKDGQGRAQVLPTPGLVELKQRYPNLWFLVRDADEIVLRYGEIPVPALAQFFRQASKGRVWKRGKQSGPPWKTVIRLPGGCNSLPGRKKASRMTASAYGSVCS